MGNIYNLNVLTRRVSGYNDTSYDELTQAQLDDANLIMSEGEILFTAVKPALNETEVIYVAAQYGDYGKLALYTTNSFDGLYFIGSYTFLVVINRSPPLYRLRTLYSSTAYDFNIRDSIYIPTLALPLSYLYPTKSEAYNALSGYPITYRLTNCTAPNAPTEAAGGSDVVVNITPTQGYILRSSGVSVMDSNGVTVPHIVQGNQIAFTMPHAP